MDRKQSVEVFEEPLPGIGMRDDFITKCGRRIGVVAHRDGHRDLLVYAKGDPDTASEVVKLTAAEADTLAELLGSRRVVERLAKISEQVDGLHTAHISVPQASELVGLTLEDAAIRGRTGAVVVAVSRDGKTMSAPSPGMGILADDVLIAIGTAEALSAAQALVDGE